MSIYIGSQTWGKPVEIEPGNWIFGTKNIYYHSKESGFLLLFEYYQISPDGQAKLVQRHRVFWEKRTSVFASESERQATRNLSFLAAFLPRMERMSRISQI